MAPALNARVAAESVFQTVTPGWFPGPYHPALQAPKCSFRGAELLSFSATYLYPAPNWTDSPGPQTSTEAHPKHDETAPEKDTTQKCSEAPLSSPLRRYSPTGSEPPRAGGVGTEESPGPFRGPSTRRPAPPGPRWLGSCTLTSVVLSNWTQESFLFSSLFCFLIMTLKITKLILQKATVKTELPHTA